MEISGEKIHSFKTDKTKKARLKRKPRNLATSLRDNSQQLLTIMTKSFIFDVWQSSEYVPAFTSTKVWATLFIKQEAVCLLVASVQLLCLFQFAVSGIFYFLKYWYFESSFLALQHLSVHMTLCVGRIDMWLTTNTFIDLSQLKLDS